MLCGILTLDLDDTVKLDPCLAAFCDYITELPELHCVTKEDIQKYLDDKLLPNMEEILYRLPAEYHNLVDAFLL